MEIQKPFVETILYGINMGQYRFFFVLVLHIQMRILHHTSVCKTSEVCQSIGALARFVFVRQKKKAAKKREK